MVFFLQPDSESVAVPMCGEAPRKEQYANRERVTSEQHIINQYTATYGKGGN